MSTITKSAPSRRPIVAVPMRSGAAYGASAGTRDVGIDFTKGALVIFMVLYHWLNYFIGSDGRYYDYLRFLTPSFIFITGFMISQIHLKRYESSGHNLAKRLAVRGLKLFAVFIVLNIFIDLFFSHSLHRYGGIRANVHVLCASLVISDPTAVAGYRGASFSMLVPIAYLLILSAALISVTTRYRLVFYAALSALIAMICLLYGAGIRSSYVDMLMVGILGAVAGFAGKDQLLFVTRRLGILVCLYLFYLAVITLWGVTFPLEVISVVLTTALLYSAGNAVSDGTFQGFMVLFGKYSLLGYISQIAILQVLRKIGLFYRHGTGGLLSAFMLGVVLTFLMVKVTDVVTRKSRAANSLYRLVFA